MSVPEGLEDLVGEWSGTNKLWLTPDEPVRESETTASVTLAAQGKFITIAYTWSFEGEPQDGLIVLGREGGAFRVIMYNITPDGSERLAVRATYAREQ
jgi:hypothetical protein